MTAAWVGPIATIDELAKLFIPPMFATRGLMLGERTHVHEEHEVQFGALAKLAGDLSTKLATIGRQAAGEPEPGAVMDQGPFALSRRSAHAGVPVSPSRA